MYRQSCMIKYYFVSTQSTNNNPLTPHVYAGQGFRAVRRASRKPHYHDASVVFSGDVKPSMQAWDRLCQTANDGGKSISGSRNDHSRQIGLGLGQRSISLIDEGSQTETLVPRQRRIIQGKDFDQLHQKPDKSKAMLERDVGSFVVASKVADLANQDPQLLSEFKGDLRKRLDEMLIHGHFKRQVAFGAPLAFVGFEPGAFFHGGSIFSSNEAEGGYPSIENMNPRSTQMNIRTAPQLARLLARNFKRDNLDSRENLKQAREILGLLTNITMGAIDMTKDFTAPRNPLEQTIQDGFVMRNVLKFTEFLVMVKNNLPRRPAQELKAKAFALLDMLNTKNLPKSEMLKRKLLVALKYEDLNSVQAQKLMAKGKVLTERQLGVDARKARAAMQNDLDLSVYAIDPLVNPDHVDSQAFRINPANLGTEDGMRSMGLTPALVSRAQRDLERNYAGSDLARLIQRSRGLNTVL